MENKSPEDTTLFLYTLDSDIVDLKECVRTLTARCRQHSLVGLDTLLYTAEQALVEANKERKRLYIQLNALDTAGK